MQKEYYFIENGKREGPYSKEALKVFGLKEDSFVWRQGLDDWVKASELEDLADLFMDDSAFGTYAEVAEDPYYAMINGERIGPASISRLIEMGLSSKTPVWKNGMSDWLPAHNFSDIMAELNKVHSENGTHNVKMPPFNQYENRNNNMNQQLNQPYKKHFDWLPLAIIGTVLGFMSACLGFIFGVIGIVQANKANAAYAAGRESEGDVANSSAKVMTIISLVIGGFSIICCVLYFLVFASTIPFVFSNL